MKVDHFKIVRPNEWLDEIDDLVNDWVTVNDVNLSRVNWMSLLRVLHVKSNRRYNHFRQMTIRDSAHIKNWYFTIANVLVRLIRCDQSNIGHHKEEFYNIIEIQLVDVVVDQAHDDQLVIVIGWIGQRHHVAVEIQSEIQTPHTILAVIIIFTLSLTSRRTPFEYSATLDLSD